MTIALRWWFVPIVLLLVGIVAMHRDKSTGMFGGCAGAFGFLLCGIAALAFTAGHFV